MDTGTKAVLLIGILLFLAWILVKFTDSVFDERMHDIIEDDHDKWNNPRDNPNQEDV